MIQDNITFLEDRSSRGQVEVIGTYEISESILVKEEMLREVGSDIKKEIKSRLTEGLHCTITADALDVPFVKKLYKGERLKDIVIDALARREMDLRMNLAARQLEKSDYEEVNFLGELIYQLRTMKDSE